MLDLSLAGRLTFTHRTPTLPALAPGGHDLGLFAERDAVLIVPEGVDPRAPTPLVTLFHGGGGSAEKIMPILRTHAEERGFLLLVPQSLFPTWDIVIAGNGPDRERLDTALAFVADRFALDPTHFAFSGHSDGGSYALSTGLSNGRLVSHIMAFSAGFMTVLAQEGEPKVFIAHGRQDTQTPIDTAGRSHAAKLRAAGYDLLYLEYDGPHASQPPMVRIGVDFFMGGKGRTVAELRAGAAS
ncbi:esterase [Ancylobacter sp. 6x-1]|uniref:Esterase n=1 Tax=Ancylobacter crimeensis TaxID=2579147 RepID=A0ABT0D6T2_9HYPH|nr:esterase [Ancylobacter crimeensis]MCK0195512.1 esterase [Ancylobacter crimeensis]